MIINKKLLTELESEAISIIRDSFSKSINEANSPYVRERQFAKSFFDKFFFWGVFITPLKVCLKRDPSGIYKKAKKDKNMNKTGLGVNYE